MAPLSAITDGRRNLSQRVLSGVVLGPLALFLAYQGGPPFDMALALAAVIGLDEWLRLVAGRRRSWLALAPAALLLPYWLGGAAYALAALALAAVAAWLILRRRIGAPILAAAGLPYLGLTVLGLAWVRDSANGAWSLAFFVFLAVWATDIGAFFIGRMIGGPRLAPAISPKKTWSGAVGGVLAATAVAAAWCTVPVAGRSLALAVAIAVVLSLAGQAGDLFESAIKRRFGVKDSGALIPGHGGMLDRIDALLVAAPLFAVLHASGLTAGLSS
jgi:phosphatidate cytidylyltransferase